MHAYPAQLADFVLDHWPAGASLVMERRGLMELLSTSFQASLAHEEGRNVRFRLVCGRPADFVALARTEPIMLLEFAERQPLTPDNLQRLSPAAPFHSSVVGATLEANRWFIWGIVHTGADWLAPSWGGRPRQTNLGLPMVHVLGAGRLAVYSGNDLVATLQSGMIEATTTDVFTSEWLSELFRRTRRNPAGEQDALALADDELMRMVAQHFVRRAIFLIRQAGHGGMILFAEPELMKSLATTGPLKLKYAFQAGEGRDHYRTLLRRLIETLAERGDEGPIDLRRFLEAETPDVASIEHAIFEVSRLVAGLAGVDGAVVLSKRFELIGFGAEVSGELPYPDTVWQALDVEAERRAPEAANSVGTRHRAAYRFVTAHPSGLAVVISHDGVVRFVANLAGSVVYWDQFLNW
jgi:hypothetical protein